MEQLCEESLGDLLEAIFTANTKWYNLGLRLGLKASLLDTIRSKFQGDPNECLREMLKEWLKLGLAGEAGPTWHKLVRALASTAVGEAALASKLKSRYCTKLDTIKLKPGETRSCAV